MSAAGAPCLRPWMLPIASAWITLALTGAACAGAASTTAPVSLPGAQEGGRTPPNMHSGYLEVGDARIFHILVEAGEDSPPEAKERVILWTNGGPGCSGLNGFFEENGPYFTLSSTELLADAWSWHNLGNMLYIESPIGVGFSWSSNAASYSQNDASVAQLNLDALLEFAKLYPQFHGAPLFLTSESYGGHYIPQLAWKIVEFTNSSANDGSLNLEGIAIGNAYSVPGDDNSTVPFMHGQMMMDEELFARATEKCMLPDGPNYACYWAGEGYEVGVCPVGCIDAVNTAVESAGDFSVYDVLGALCGEEWLRATQQVADLDDDTRSRSFRGMFERKTRQSRRLTAAVIDPCISSYTPVYLNNKLVQDALHVTRATTWAACASASTAQGYRYPLERTSQVPIYERLMALPTTLRPRILVFSGDVDACVPFVGTREWMETLSTPISEPWHVWLAGQNLGGYIEARGTAHDQRLLQFATVRGAGHMAPATEPTATFTLLERFLSSTLE